jgi:hypothetical protein
VVSQSVAREALLGGGGRLSTVDLLIFVKKVNNISNVKRADPN